MRTNFLPGLICFLMFVSLAGCSVADEAPSYVAYIQGGASSITEGSDGAMIITVQDIIPYFHIGDGMRSSLSPIETLTNVTYPLNAVVVFSGADNESTSMALVENLSLSDGNKVLNLQVTPMKSYDGERLKTLANAATPLDKIDITKAGSFSLYIDFKQKAPENSHCEWCQCHDNSGSCQGY